MNMRPLELATREAQATFSLRRAVADDASALAEFGARTFAETFGAENTRENLALHLQSAWHPDLQRAEILDPALETVLAHDTGGTLTGFAQIRADHAPACVPTVNAIELLRFYVDKPWQGRGLARALMTEVEARARARGARELWLGVWERNPRA